MPPFAAAMPLLAPPGLPPRGAPPGLPAPEGTPQLAANAVCGEPWRRLSPALLKCMEEMHARYAAGRQRDVQKAPFPARGGIGCASWQELPGVIISDARPAQLPAPDMCGTSSQAEIVAERCLVEPGASPSG